MADLIVFWILVSLATFTTAIMDTSVCSGLDPGKNDPNFPTLPEVFETHVEVNIQNRNFTTDFHLYFDKPNNRVMTKTTTAGVQATDMYFFATQELLHFDRTSGICTNENLAKAPLSRLVYLFGNVSGNKAAMYTAEYALRFHDGEVQHQYINRTTIRGITVDYWKSCVYMAINNNATMQVDWYFSAQGWITQSLDPQIPVRLHISGSIFDDNQKRRLFDHSYDFADFRPGQISEKSFETPSGIYCKRTSAQKPLSNPQTSFHFTAEIVQPDRKVVTNIKEWYDGDLNLVKFDYVPVNRVPYGISFLTEVHDFNTGVAYISDNVRGNCTATSISSGGFDVRNADPTHIRIRTPKEFLYFDNVAYVYEGKRTVRDILADVWIAQRSDWPFPDAHVNSTWEWYFATPNYSENLAQPLLFALPVMLKINGDNGYHSIYNIYDYEETNPTIWSFDISKCYNYTERRDFSLLLPGDFKTLVNSNMEQFRYAVLHAITKAGSVNQLTLSALRITHILVDYADNNDIIVQFVLLDKAPQIGDVPNVLKENDLNTVASAISDAIDGENFKVSLVNPVTGVATSMTAKKYSLTPTQVIIKKNYYVQTKPGSTISTGTSGGAMAGMAVALVVAFFLLGVLGTYLFYRKRGGAFLPKKFDDKDITQSEFEKY